MSRLRLTLASLASLAVATLAACGGTDPVVPRGGPDTTHVFSPAALDSAERAPQAADDTLFASVVVGDGVSCALTRGGRAFCWGDDRLAQLGIAQGPHGCPYDQNVSIGQLPACSPAPVAVDTGRKFVALAAGGAVGRVCGLTVVGRIWCWGGDRVYHSVWLIPSGDVRYQSLGDPPDCAVRTTGSIDCFGWKLSTPQYLPPSGGPTWSPFDGGATARYASLASPCATTADGELHCWGDLDTTMFATKGASHDVCTAGGTPGRPEYHYNCHYPPVRLALAGTWRRPVEAPYPCCAISADGRLQVWQGDLSFTREWPSEVFVGGVRPSSANPLATVAIPEPVQRAWIDYSFQCAWGVSGRLWCFGSDGVGRYGNGAIAEAHDTPTLVAGGRAFVSVDVTSDHACGVTSDGAVLCWGSDANGQLGIGGGVAPGTCANGIGNCVAEPTRIASVAGKRSAG